MNEFRSFLHSVLPFHSFVFPFLLPFYSFVFPFHEFPSFLLLSHLSFAQKGGNKREGDSRKGTHLSPLPFWKGKGAKRKGACCPLFIWKQMNRGQKGRELICGKKEKKAKRGRSGLLSLLTIVSFGRFQTLSVAMVSRVSCAFNLPEEASPNSNPSHLQSLPPPQRVPYVIGDTYQTSLKPTCAWPEPL